MNKYLWMSFCDPLKQKGTQFLGVVLTKELILANAIDYLWEIDVNPGGEISAIEFESDDDFIKSKVDRLLNGSDLAKALAVLEGK